MKRIAFYGGSFDPLHCGHLTIARKLTEQFALDKFVFIPAFHAPHKKDKKPTSAFHRYAMLALATNDETNIEVSKMELDLPERPYTHETLTRLKEELSDTEIFFVMGADSWADITTWREWEKVLTMVNIIVMTRPDYEISFNHVTDEIRQRIIDLRVKSQKSKVQSPNQVFGFDFEKNTTKLWTLDSGLWTKIFISNAVQIDVSATEIRQKIRDGAGDWRECVPVSVVRYIEKYGLYLK